MNQLERYLKELHDIRSTGAGVDETSYYGALEELLNSIGKKLKPKVRCVIQLRSAGAGHPDAGLFPSKQLSDAWEANPDAAPIPERGVVEVKSASADVWEIARTEQVRKYLERYGLVLVTNFRHFLLVKPDAKGEPERLGEYVFAPTEAAFWAMAAHPGTKETKEKAEELTEFLKRVMCERAPLYKPEDVAWFLAFYAREALKRIEAKAELPELSSIKEAMEEALGLKFEGKKEEEREKGRHFFRSSLVQTLFYGVFSAWISWHKEDGKGDFNWHEAGWFQHVPVIRALFDKLANPSTLKPLDLAEVLDWAGEALNRVEPEFFDLFEGEHAVQYFYEPFLKAFDPELRKQLGVWYTPPEIVRYMVERVDRALRCELGIDDGLASDRVYVLDPCCGTGAYLVQVLDRIERTLKEKGEGDLWASRLKKAAQERVFGFEILPAPFVVAHLQLGLKLDELGVPLSDDERVGVYLTNALTGWEFHKTPPIQWSELEQERKASGRVKREEPILVILGNPPYNAFAGISPEEEEGLVEIYKGVYWISRKSKSKKEGRKGKLIRKKDGSIVHDKRYRLNDPPEMGGWGIKKFNLDDLYIRFFRIAERRIAEKTGKGIVSFISNHSWISDPSFVVLREHLLKSFDRIWIENMHGNRKISEYAPNGRTSETIFSIKGFSSGIRQGVVVSIWVKKGNDEKPAKVLYRNDINDAKALDRQKHLLRTLEEEDFDSHYEEALPDKTNRYSFRPGDVENKCKEWPTLVDLSGVDQEHGPVVLRDFCLGAFEKDTLVERMEAYFDPKVDNEQVKKLHNGLMTPAYQFDPEKVRRFFLSHNIQFSEEKIVRYIFKPFDVRFYYNELRGRLCCRPSPVLIKHAWKGNTFLISRSYSPRPLAIEGHPIVFSRIIGDYDMLGGHARFFPIRIKPQPKKSAREQAGQKRIHDDEVEAKPIANLSSMAREYLESLGITNPDTDADTAGLIWMHALAIGYSPAYLDENADGIRQDWPRIPLPASKELLERSAALGRSIAELLDTEEDVKTVITGSVRPELKVIGVVKYIGEGQLDENKGHLDITAGWGHPGKAGVTMPGKGRYEEREYTEEERQAIIQGAKALGLSEDEAFNRLGKTTFDIYLNDTAYWRNVPKGVWRYYIGGYQVIKKWLSYREKRMLGRGITPNEATEVRNMTRRLTAIRLLEPQLDENYQRVRGKTYTWPA